MVSDRDPERLRYLAHIGIFPKTEILIIDKAPFNGPLHLQIQDQTHHLGKELADAILVDYIESL
jgi:DtxR family Mn-dependent transcriptional regulator